MAKMKRISYPKAIDELLLKIGFVRLGSRKTWRRRVGDYLDVIDLQSSFTEVTVNVSFTDEFTANIVNSARPPGYTGGTLYPVTLRVGTDFLDGKDKWWGRSDPDGPVEIVQAIRSVMPFFDNIHSLEGMKAYLQAHVVKWRQPEARLHLAVTLSRLGETGQALDVLDEPTPKWWSRDLPLALVQITNLRAIIAAA